MIKLEQNILDTKRFVVQPYNAVFLIAWGVMLLGYWRGINNHLPVLGSMTDELEYCIVLLPILLSLPKFLKQIKPEDHFFVIGCLFLYTLNFFFFPQNEVALIKRWLNYSIFTVPFYYIGVTLDIKKFIKAFYYVSITAVIICAFYELSYLQSSSYTGDSDTSEYNMDLAYNLLPHVLMVSWQALKSMRLWKISIMLLGLMMLLSFGTRGPVVCAITFIAIYLLFIRPSKYQKTIRVITISVSIFVISFLDQFMLFMQVFTYQIGMSTRIFDKYLEGDLDKSAGRDYIRETIMRELSTDDSLLGHGILGSYKYVGTYPHNIVLDFLFSYGWFFGTLLLFIILIIIVKMLRACRYDETLLVFGVLLVISSILKMCFSGTYIDDTLFFFLLGYCVQNGLRKK